MHPASFEDRYDRRLVHENTIEEKVIERANLKLQLDSAIKFSDKGKTMNKNDLMNMIQVQ